MRIARTLVCATLLSVLLLEPVSGVGAKERPSVIQIPASLAERLRKRLSP